MNKNLLTFFTITTIVFGAFSAVSFHGVVSQHEAAHAETFERFGCDNIEIEYSYFDGDEELAKTTADCKKISEDQKLAHQNIHTVQKLLYVPYAVLVLLTGYVLYTMPIAKSCEESP